MIPTPLRASRWNWRPRGGGADCIEANKSGSRFLNRPFPSIEPSSRMNTNVVILAAGLGTRMKSKRAKVLHRAGGLSLVEHVVNAAMAITTPDRISVVVGHQADEVIATLEPAGVRFVKQTEQK